MWILWLSCGRFWKRKNLRPSSLENPLRFVFFFTAVIMRVSFFIYIQFYFKQMFVFYAQYDKREGL